MDKIEKYKNIIQQELEYQATKLPDNAPNIHNHLVVNENRTDFLLLSIGWEGKFYRHNILFHYQIKANKVILMKNNTDILINKILVEQGIATEDIEINWIPDYLKEMA